MKLKFRWLFSLCVLFAAFNSAAITFTINGLTYETNSDGKTCSVGLVSSGSYPSNIVIPATISYNNVSYDITEVRTQGFRGKNKIDSVFFETPSKVIVIGSMAFESSSIKYVKLPDSLTDIMSSAFKDCSNLNQDIEIPKKVISIGDYAFAFCKIQALELNEGLIDLGKYAFAGCKASYVDIPSTLEIIGDGAFASSSLKSVNFKSDGNLKTIGSYAFSNVVNLAEVDIPATVTEIKYGAFFCDGLPNVMPEKVHVHWDRPSVASVSNAAFHTITGQNGVYHGPLLYVPKGTIPLYRNATPWSEFKYIYEDPTLSTNLVIDNSLQICVGEQKIISATVTPDDADNKSLSWVSSNPEIVTVNESGTVTGIKPGVSQVIATTMDGSNLSDTCTVTVVTGKAQSITVSPTSAQLEIGGMTRLTATILPEDVPNKTVMWTSSNEEIAMVSSTGMVYAVGPGSVIITASTTDGSNLSATCQVTVDAPFSLSAQSVAVPVNTKRNIPIIVDNHVDVKSFKFTVHVPDSIEFYSNALPGPRCSNFNVTTTFNADSTLVQVSGVMTTLPLASGTGAFVLLPIKSSKYIADFDARLTDITFTGTNDNVGTQQLPDITVTLRVLNLGDVNGDKVVDVSDINALINYMLGKPMTGTFNFNLGDLDENGIIDISDINAVINLMLGKY